MGQLRQPVPGRSRDRAAPPGRGGSRTAMGLMQALARMDAVVLPRLARGARRIARFLRRGPRGPLTAIAVVFVLLVAAVLVAQSAGHLRAADQPDRSARVGVSDGDWIPDYL